MGPISEVRGKKEGGIAFNHVNSGLWYPAFSAYDGGSVRANFGPLFKHDPVEMLREAGVEYRNVKGFQEANREIVEPKVKSDKLEEFRREQAYRIIKAEKSRGKKKLDYDNPDSWSDSEIVQLQQDNMQTILLLSELMTSQVEWTKNQAFDLAYRKEFGSEFGSEL